MFLTLCVGLFGALSVFNEPVPHAVIRAHTGPVARIRFSSDGKTLASFSEPEEIKVFDTKTGKERATIKSEKGVSFALLPGGQMIATWVVARFKNPHGRVCVWDIAKAMKQTEFEHGEWLGSTSVRFAPTGKLILSLGEKQTRGWNATSGKQQFSLEVDSRESGKVTFSPSGALLATVETSGLVNLWDTMTGRRFRTFQAYEGPVETLAFSPSGRYLATLSEAAGAVKLWEVATSQQAAEFHGTGTAHYVQFAPNGRTLVTTHFGRVSLWDIGTGRENARFLRATRGAVAFAADGKSLFCWRPTLWVITAVPGEPSRTSRLANGEISVWDLATLTEQATLHEPEGTVLAIAEDGSVIARGERDGTIKLWFVNKLLEQKPEK